MNTNMRLDSKEWQDMDLDGITGNFVAAGFQNTEELLSSRILDLLKIRGIDTGTVSTMILLLYKVFNRKKYIDMDMDLGFIDQYFDFKTWKKQHRDFGKITVGDIVLDEDVNKKAVIRLYEMVEKEYFKSLCREVIPFFAEPRVGKYNCHYKEDV